MFRDNKISIIIVIVLLGIVLIFAGCKDKKANPQPSDTENRTTSGDNQTNQTNSTGEGGRTASEVPEGYTQAFGTSKQLSEEDIAGITQYGVFRFPDSTFVPERSLRQYHPDGTEIYRLQFGTEVPAGTVADWYENNLERGTTRTDRDIATGALMVGFEYQSSDSTWHKNVTITGGAGNTGCQITVSLTRQAPPPETSPSDEASGAQ